MLLPEGKSGKKGTFVAKKVRTMTAAYHTVTLENGLRCALLPVRSRVVWCGFGIHSGSRDDPEGLPGLAHFVEHTLFKGTTHRRADHIRNRMEVVGGSIDAYTTKDETVVYTVGPRGELTRAMELLGDLIRHSTFPERELEPERGVVRDEINLYRDTPSDRIFDEWDERFFRDRTLAHPILGDTRSLDRMSREDLLSYTERTFRPDRLLFFVMGQVTPQRFEELCKRYLSEPFSSRVQSSPRPELQLPIALTDQSPHIVHSRTHQAHTLLGGLGVTYNDPDRAAQNLLLQLLAGDGMNTRLNVELREQRGWVYNVEASVTCFPDVGWWQIYFGSDDNHAEEALGIVLEELDRLMQEPLSEQSLRAWKKQTKGLALVSSEQSESTFLSFGRQMLLRGRYEALEEYFARIDAVTTESLMETARSLFAHPFTLIYNGKK